MKTITSILSIFICFFAQAQTSPVYQSLDPTDPITFGENFIIYQQDSITLGPRSFFIDGQLSDLEVVNYPYVFNSIQSAAEKLVNGTEDEPMVLHIAPYVYWIDDPDDPEIRTPEPGDRAPYGMKIKCEWLRFHGLSKRAENVVLACNRGQTIGAKGNFTMFRFSGDGTSSENITFGNYCNIDLEYPLNPELSREKRASAIVQAQLIHCNGDKIVARNTHFLSRLNLCPFVGAKRILFDQCHFESTDDALCGTGVYLNSTLDFYSSKPFYHTTGTGAVFLNCNIQSLGNTQYFTKANGQVAVVDTRISGDQDLYIGWRDLPPLEMRNYQHNVTLNQNPIYISSEDSVTTVKLENKPLLKAYRVEHRDSVIYNTYNLLRGGDDWDPMNVKGTILQAEKDLKANLTSMPVQLLLSPTRETLETEKDTATLSARLMRFGNYETNPEALQWTLAPGSEQFATLQVAADRLTCKLIPANATVDSEEVVVQATAPSGLEAASVFTVTPKILEAPGLVMLPKLSTIKDGKISLQYSLASKYEDQSIITWYRCADKKGSNPIEVAVSRFGQPLISYELSHGDIGYYLKATIAPKHIRSVAGKPIETITKKPIKASDVTASPNMLHPYFSKLSVANQPQAIPGFWTFRHIENPDRNVSGNAWHYGEGRDGAAGISGLLQGRSGFLSYTPLEEKGDMKIKVKIAPFKSAGQGFSVAPLHMDLLVKFDSETMTGYGLRIMRTTKYGNAVDFLFVKYENGQVTTISEPISTSCYRTFCEITLKYEKERLIASASTDSKYNKDSYQPEVLPSVDMSTTVPGSKQGGFGIFYNGGASAVIKDLKVVWN